MLKSRRSGVSMAFSLTHFWPMFQFHTPCGFLVFSEGRKWEHWPEMSQAAKYD